jgi:hypothetical protein
MPFAVAILTSLAVASGLEAKPRTAGAPGGLGNGVLCPGDPVVIAHLSQVYLHQYGSRPCPGLGQERSRDGVT